MSRLPTCPLCETPIDNDLLPGAFDCPACGAELRTSVTHGRAMFVVALTLTAFGALALDLTDAHFAAAVAIGVWPTLLVISALDAALFPVDLEPRLGPHRSNT